MFIFSLLLKVWQLSFGRGSTMHDAVSQTHVANRMHSFLRGQPPDRMHKHPAFRCRGFSAFKLDRAGAL